MKIDQTVSVILTFSCLSLLLVLIGCSSSQKEGRGFDYSCYSSCLEDDGTHNGSCVKACTDAQSVQNSDQGRHIRKMTY